MSTQPINNGIPVIDLSPNNLEPGTPTWVRTREDVRRAMEELGCFQAIYDTKAAEEIHIDILAAAEELFNLPVETKSQKLSDKPYFGYFGQHPSFPLYESLPVDHPATVEGSRGFTDAMWPAGNLKFCQSNLAFSKVVVEIDQLAMKMLTESYRIKDSFYDEYVKSTNYVLRYFKYKAPKEDEDNMGLASHTDKSMVSVLHQNHVNGLQIRTKYGVWVDADFSPSSFIVMAGDALMAWSNDKIPSCFHRVIMKETGRETRYSLGLGSIVKGTLQTPQEMCDESRPLLYKPFDQFEYLRFYESKPDHKPECPIKAYCGI
ncbi:unnamed protein product [Linum trigynum]|uniref:Fe2OG dioxygenase domain-containing protein n=1 Tax=Linum trigynum TaxID=586398 RepID=A0AAV2EV70_9ROSI